MRTLIKEAINKIGEDITVCGWIKTHRSHGKLVFIDLRDISGTLQVVFLPSLDEKTQEIAKQIRPEWVVEITGTINKRPGGTENKNISSGNIEMAAKDIKVISPAKTLPFDINTDGYEINEELRLKYRYLDLRRGRLKRNLIIRQNFIHFVRDFLRDRGFIEIDTPSLTKSTPEGARDFLVPSRLQPETFYALPQSPQQYKQLLMVAGLERYFQIAKCFRDEDPRADRQAEFSQIDIEASFMEKDEILKMIETMIIEAVKIIFPEKKIKEIPFPKITHKEVMEKYNSDKPDLRDDKNNPNELAFAFVVDFPMFEIQKKDKTWKAVHHPFTRPQTEDIGKMKENPGNILAHQYDLVLNGYEIGGGSLRSFKPEILEAVFEVLGHTKQEIKEKFGHLLEAFGYGVPPHGGIALGLDRILAVLLNEPNIREVMPFPKTGDSKDLMMDSPSAVDKAQLEELHLQISKKTSKGKPKK